MGRTKKILLSIITAVLAIAFINVPAFAADLDCSKLSDAGKQIFCANQGSISGDNALSVVIGNIVLYLIGIVGIVLTIVILVSAIQYVTSGGSPDRIKSAKDRLVQAAVSLGFLISFNAIFNLLNTRIFANVDTTKLKGVTDLSNNVISVLLFAVGALAVIFIIIGGIQYTTSAGDSNKVTKAKTTITYAIIGLIMSLSVGIVISVLNAFVK